MLQIGSKPGQRAFQAKQGGDTYLVLSQSDRMLYLYTTVETLLCPGITVFEEYADRPYFWSEDSGMMSILSEVCHSSFEHISDREDADMVLEGMEEFLEKL